MISVRRWPETSLPTMESEALQQMVDTLGQGNPVAAEIVQLWNEYEEGVFPEALFVKDIDKFEMIVTAHEYETSHPEIRLEQFLDYTAGRFQTPLFQALDMKLRNRGSR